MAHLAMLKHIITCGDRAMHMLATIAQQTYRDIVRIFSGIFRLWISSLVHILHKEAADRMGEGSYWFHSGTNATAPEIPTVIKFFKLERDLLFQEVSGRESPVRHMLKFCIKASRLEAHISRGMLDAGGLALILMAFSNREFIPTRLANIDYGRQLFAHPADRGYPTAIPIPIRLINDEAATLTALMNDPPFRSSWPEQSFRSRKNLCSYLLKEFMGATLDERYSWARALFLKILI